MKSQGQADTKIQEATGLFHGHVSCRLYDLKGNLIETKEYDNIVVNVFKNAIAGLLGNEAGAFSGIINYGAVGTGTSSPAATDTVLETEIQRVAVYGTPSRVANVETIEFYYGPTEANGTLTEFGAFVDGTATVDTGIMFDRVNISVTKTSLNSLIIALTITVS